ncbi:MAG: hypothetical protein ACI8PB_005237 [Desulforhopalus sp.]
MLFNIDENTTISILCDLSTDVSIEEVHKYLEHQSFKKYQLIILQEGYNPSCAGKSKNSLLWSMDGNLFVFASSIDLRDPLFISNIVSNFYTNRELALVLSIDKEIATNVNTNSFLTRQSVLELMEAAVQAETTLNSQSFRVIAGYKSVTKPSGWYKDQLSVYEDLNLVYRILIKANVRIDISPTQNSNKNRRVCKHELIHCIDKILYIESDNALIAKCKRLRKLSKEIEV